MFHNAFFFLKSFFNHHGLNKFARHLQTKAKNTQGNAFINNHPTKFYFREGVKDQ